MTRDKFNRTLLTMGVILLLAGLLVGLHHGAPEGSASAGVTNSADLLPAPVPGREFDFLVGDWRLEVKPKVSGLVALIHGVPTLRGIWHAERSDENGSAGIRDQLRIFDGSGNPTSDFLSTRHYQSARQQWHVQSQDQARLQQSTGSASWHDHRLEVMSIASDADGPTSEVRSQFSEITANRFRYVVAKRAPKPSSVPADQAHAPFVQTLEVIATRDPHAAD